MRRVHMPTGTLLTLVDKMREYQLHVTFAFQYFGQVPTEIRTSLLLDTEVKALTTCEDGDASTFAKALKCTPKELEQLEGFQFRIGAYGKATTVNLEYGWLGKLPQLSQAQWEAWRAENAKALKDEPAPPQHKPANTFTPDIPTDPTPD